MDNYQDSSGRFIDGGYTYITIYCHHITLYSPYIFSVTKITHVDQAIVYYVLDRSVPQ